jgi:hypothetical protein
MIHTKRCDVDVDPFLMGQRYIQLQRPDNKALQTTSQGQNADTRLVPFSQTQIVQPMQ